MKFHEAYVRENKLLTRVEKCYLSIVAVWDLIKFHFSSQSPLFLMFLDCVWQLLEQYPAAFEFSEMYLTILYDSARISLFGTFLFNCPHQRVKESTVSIKCYSPFSAVSSKANGTPSCFPKCLTLVWCKILPGWIWSNVLPGELCKGSKSVLEESLLNFLFSTWFSCCTLLFPLH